MANWNFDPRISANSQDPEVRQLQQAMMDLTRLLRVTMRELDAENIAPDFLPDIQNGKKGEVQIVKNKAPNAYFGNDGELFKVIDPVGGGSGDALSHMPVGYVYISTDSTSPQVLFGGTWERIAGRFLLAADDTYTAGSTGGEATHVLTEAEMPKHRHSITARAANGSASVQVESYASGDSARTPYTNYAGSSAAHNNMPPYLSVYMWRRTA